MAGEELIGVLTFVLKALLRLTPVAFGAGVVCGTAVIAVACFQAAVGETALPGSLATADVARRVLVASAALPLAAYLAFLFGNLVLNILAGRLEPARQA